MLAAAFIGNALWQPFFDLPKPAPVECLDMEHGAYSQFNPKPKTIFDFGLNYSKHIQEGIGLYNPDKPLVFFKHLQTLNDNSVVNTPSQQQLMTQFELADPQLAQHIKQNHGKIPPLLDYEVEVGYLLLEDVTKTQLNNPNYVPKLGYFLVNEFTSRTPLILSGTIDRVEAFNIAKGFPGFLTYADQYWVPNQSNTQSGLCVQLTTTVNGVLRQNANSSDLIRSPKQIISAVAKLYPNIPMLKGDLILTGTPEGISLKVPVWKQNLAKIVNPPSTMKFDAFADLESSAFLKAGDTVTVRATGLGEIKNTIQ